ncbi:Na+/H+ antiporter NhaA [Campylobacter canadensis]|uniref:Na(+)/H(+) antiporter NhaA n=1 Tax=Campylobacter canadensis TaxID=449520 RepID=A0ABS7WTN5_9BACT|nr:Na+/H+ antiporter NhaA [Campylobacter canadensis]MBZ7987379.1 Na+/H+ antiporter NhaA [Campylobacter canadensis]MBZ7994739.1 Na+/H+ antiporter NhaA [Campylobacter canadensis]MBZ7996553.1 Na+/H+ antiporter NhaA [Campylobacter canadensis]MBZ7998450.1 Na+/H+ antiporter NhaA [Campylobacter canadensis]MBZ8001878.1 Na+/H+ antiporter NhaA [Campylobacter canadensis]
MVKFFKSELFAPILLLFVSFIAICLNNSPLSELYNLCVNYKFGIIFGDLELIKPMLLWVNDGLMAIFFFWVGLEVKKEFMCGELKEIKAALLPLFAACGGVVVPALVYYVFNFSDDIRKLGFAIPTATDTAFALGILLLLGKKVNKSLYTFLLSLAIFDDIAAIVIIALFYTNDLSILALSLAGIGVVLLFVLNFLNVTIKFFYILVGTFIWLCVLKSGVHTTLAGMLCAFFIPLKSKEDEHFLEHIMHELTPFIQYLILPIFALFNAGVVINGIGLENFNSVFFGIFLALFFGKQFGVFAFCLLAKKLNIIINASLAELYGVCILTGIGFTMSFFINTLVFEEHQLLFDSARLAVVMASFCSAILGFIWLKIVLSKK